MARGRLEVYPWLFLAGYLVIGGYLILGGAGRRDRQGKPLGGDFVAYYAAASLVKEGRAVAAYDVAELHERERAIIGGPVALTPFFYPPPVLLALAPLALLPYGLALAFWVLVSVALYVVVIRPDRALLPAALAFPGLFQNVIQGQNGCVSLALVGGGLALLATRPFAAGLLLGLLGYKPQLVPLVVVALVAGRHWRALGGMVVAGAVMVGASLGVLGVDAWPKFISAAALAANLALAGELPWVKMTSLGAAVRLLGGGATLALAAQAALSILAAIAVANVWARPRDRLSDAVLVLGMLVAAPFAFDYDLTLLALPLLWLYLEEGNRGLLALGYLTPFLGPLIAAVTHVLLTPISLAALLFRAVGQKRLKKLATPSGP